MKKMHILMIIGGLYSLPVFSAAESYIREAPVLVYLQNEIGVPLKWGISRGIEAIATENTPQLLQRELRPGEEVFFYPDGLHEIIEGVSWAELKKTAPTGSAFKITVRRDSAKKQKNKDSKLMRLLGKGSRKESTPPYYLTFEVTEISDDS